MNVRRAIARYPLSSSLSMKPPRRNAEYTFSVFKFVVLLDAARATKFDSFFSNP